MAVTVVDVYYSFFSLEMQNLKATAKYPFCHGFKRNPSKQVIRKLIHFSNETQKRLIADRQTDIQSLKKSTRSQATIKMFV